MIKSIQLKIEKNRYHSVDSLAYSFFVSGAVGSPQIYRFEFGCNLEMLSIALTYGKSLKKSELSNNLIGTKIGVQSDYFENYIPFIFFHYGFSINGNFFDKVDNILMLYLGLKIPISKNVFLSPEFGYVSTKVCVENCRDQWCLFGDCDLNPIYLKNQQFGIGLKFLIYL